MSLYSNLHRRIERLRKSHHSLEAALHFDDGSSRVINLPVGGALTLLNDLARLRSWQLGRPEGRKLQPGEEPFTRDDGGSCPKSHFVREMRLFASVRSLTAEDPLVEIAHELAVEVFAAERKCGLLQS